MASWVSSLVIGTGGTAEDTDMATTRRGTTRTAAKAKAAPVKATPTKAAAAPKAGTRKAAAPKAAAPRKAAARTAASASAIQRKAAAKAAPKATPSDDADTSAKYAWGEHTKSADYVWLTGEAAKLKIDQAGKLGMRLNKSKAELLRTVVESGKWIDGTRMRSKALLAELARIVADYDAGTSWKVRDKRTGLVKENGYKQIQGVSQEARRLVVLLHVQTSRRAQSTKRAVDPNTWAAPQAADGQ
jgi:hypothetical protein